MNKKIVSTVLALSLAVSMVTPAFAATTTGGTTGGSHIPADPGYQTMTGSVEQSGVAPVIVDIEAKTFSVSIPTNFPVYVDSNGTVYKANNTPVINNTNSPVRIVSVNARAINGYELVDFNYDYKDTPVGSQKIGLSLFNKNVPITGTADISALSFISGNGRLNVDYNANLAAQNKAISHTPVNITFAIDWYTGTGGGTGGGGTGGDTGGGGATQTTYTYTTEEITAGKPGDGYRITNIDFRGATDALDLNISSPVAANTHGNTGTTPLDIKEINTTALNGKKFNSINVNSPTGTMNIQMGTFKNVDTLKLDINGTVTVQPQAAQGARIQDLNVGAGVTEMPLAWDGATITNKNGVPVTPVTPTPPPEVKAPYTFTTVPMDSGNPTGNHRIVGIAFTDANTTNVDLVIPSMIMPGEYGNTGTVIMVKEFASNCLQNQTFNSVTVKVGKVSGATPADAPFSGLKVNTLEIQDGVEIGSNAATGAVIQNLIVPATATTIAADAWNGATVVKTSEIAKT